MKYRFWFSDKYGLIRQQRSQHPEIWRAGQWKVGSEYVADAITGMGEDPYSCGEFSEPWSEARAAEYAAENAVDLFAEPNSPLEREPPCELLRRAREDALGGISVAIATPVFKPWVGKPPGDSYGSKPIVDYNGTPAFAELALLSALKDSGWGGVWIDTYRNRMLQRYWPLEVVTELPDGPRELLRSIEQNDALAKPWDLFCWSPKGFLFVECKRKGRDKIRPSQIRFLQSAVAQNVPAAAFMVAEWSLGNAA